MTIKNRCFSIILITICLVGFFSCKVKKNVTSVSAIVKTDTTEIKLNEDARKEFEYLFIEGLKQRTLENFDEIGRAHV